MYCMVFVTVSKIKIRKVSDTASSTMLQKISCSVKDLKLQNDLKNPIFSECTNRARTRKASKTSKLL